MSTLTRDDIPELERWMQHDHAAADRYPERLRADEDVRSTPLFPTCVWIAPPPEVARKPRLARS